MFVLRQLIRAIDCSKQEMMKLVLSSVQFSSNPLTALLALQRNDHATVILRFYVASKRITINVRPI
jgi:hypothetical protein